MTAASGSDPSAAGDARQALRDLVERYARGADRRMPAEVADLFVPDGRLAIFEGGLSEARSDLRGRAMIEKALGRLSRYRVTTHLLGQQHVDELDLGRGRAAAETYCMAHHVTDGPPARDHLMAIRYLDEFERTSEGWRFLERRLIVDWTADTTIE